MKILILIIFFPFYITLAQGPGESYNPMTAPGARGVPAGQSHWVNPPGVIFNELYISTDSLLVANLDTSVRKLNGFPSTVYSSVNFNNLYTLERSKKYFWRIVNYDLSGTTASPVWNFRNRGIYQFIEDDFNDGLTNWIIFGPQGFNNWNSNFSSFAGGSPPELRFKHNPVFNGTSYLKYKDNFNIHFALISFKYTVDWWDWPNGIGLVGVATSVNEGNTWQSLWEISVGEDTSQAEINISIPTETNVEIAFYFKGNSNNINFFYVDNFRFYGPLTPGTQPSMLIANYDTTNHKIILNWNYGSSPDQIQGYRIQRKEGLPNSLNEFINLADVSGVNTLSFIDSVFNANLIYTYRVRLIAGPLPSVGSSWSNEATVYTPSIIPVELSLFNGYVENNNIILNWQTTTETNNMGFEVQRTSPRPPPSQGGGAESGGGWEVVGFVYGNGTTTEFNNYSFNDNNLSAGKHKYKLKQIDFDGKFVYSDILEFEIINLPERFELLQNYPNPFNPSTEIRYQIAEDSKVILKVYDVLGNEVKTLVNEFKSAGNYKINFDASKLSSGIYYYRLTTGEFVQTKKMIMIK